MKTYFSDIIPRIQRYSQELDNLTLLTNQHWVVIDDINNAKNVYIFRPNNELLISQNGKVEKAKWEYLGHNSLLIDRKDESFLFKHGFFDENILALKIDSKEEYAFLVNETKYEKELNSLEAVAKFLKHKYLNQPAAQQIDYVAPAYKINFKSTGMIFLGGFIKTYTVDFEDGLSGEIHVKLKNLQAYFITMDGWFNFNHVYQDQESCINGMHYYFKTKSILYKGFLAKN
jgi:hypothetical protein